MADNPRHRQTQNLLLMKKILRAEGSPFTVVLDCVEQGAGGVVREVLGGAKASKTHTIYISHDSLYPPAGTSTFIKARRKTPDVLKKEILAAIPSGQKTLLILSPLPPSLLHPSIHLPTYLLSLLSPSPSTSLLLIYHTDIPLPTQNPYNTPPLTLLNYLATTILTLHSFPQHLARKRARELAREEPRFGIAEEREGVVVGLGGDGVGMGRGMGKGVVVEMEYRRKSGRPVVENFYLSTSTSPSPSPSQPPSSTTTTTTPNLTQTLILLDDHPLYKSLPSTTAKREESEIVKDEDLGATFNMGLTEKQRKDREGVVLPYYDAQKGDGGGGGGGRILYEMGVEDDFDEEEDEM